MLLEFSLENFLSFKDNVSFSMLANGTKGLDDNYVNVFDKKVLKTAAIYGANASGKSNLFKVLDLVGSMIGNSINANINSKLPIVPFKFEDTEKLSRFEIKFIKEGIKYVYGFSANSLKVVDEYLYYYPNGREAKIFDRTETNVYSFAPSDNKILNEIKEKTAANKFFLSVATNWNYKKTKPAYDFLTIDLGTCFNLEMLKTTAFKFYSSDSGKKKKKAILNFLKQADFNIADFDVEVRKIPREFLPNNISYVMNDEEYKVFNAKFTHVFNGKKYTLDFEEESAGTQIFFILLPFVAIAMDTQRVLIVDELDRGLHPFLVQYIVSIFNNPNINTNGAQLIFNTHDTNLLDLNLLRRDQIWFTEKNSATGSSDLYSLSDFSVRKNENIEKGYLLGRYGAVPFINNEFNLWEEK